MSNNKPIEKAALSFTDNKLIGFAFFMALIPFTFMRYQIGVRTLKPQVVLFNISCLWLITYLCEWITSLPLVSAQLDFAAWKIFTLLYMIVSLVHIIRGRLEAKTIPFTYTRSLGNSYLYGLWTRLNIRYFRSEIRFQAVIEPLIVFLISRAVYYLVAPNLGNFLTLSAICVALIGRLVIDNENSLRWDQNDSLFMGDKVKDNISRNRETENIDVAMSSE